MLIAILSSTANYCKRAWANFSGCDPQFRELARVPVRELYELIAFVPWTVKKKKKIWEPSFFFLFFAVHGKNVINSYSSRTGTRAGSRNLRSHPLKLAQARLQLVCRAKKVWLSFLQMYVSAGCETSSQLLRTTLCRLLPPPLPQLNIINILPRPLNKILTSSE